MSTQRDQVMHNLSQSRSSAPLIFVRCHAARRVSYRSRHVRRPSRIVFSSRLVVHPFWHRGHAFVADVAAVVRNSAVAAAVDFEVGHAFAEGAAGVGDLCGIARSGVGVVGIVGGRVGADGGEHLGRHGIAGESAAEAGAV